MSNYYEAKDLLSNNVGGLVKIVFFNIILSIITSLVSSILPPLGSLVSVVISIFMIYLNLVLINEIFIKNNTSSFIDVVKDSINVIKNNQDRSSVSALLVYFAQIILISVILFIVLFCMGTAFVFNGFSFFGLFFMVAFILLGMGVVILCAYRFQYKITASVLYEKRLINIPNTEIWKMTGYMILCSLFLLIPFVGIVFYALSFLWLNYLFTIKIILDVEQI